MTTMTAPPVAPEQNLRLRARRLPVVALLGIAVAAVAVAALLVYATGIGGFALVVALAMLLYLVGLFAASSAVEGRRQARNRTWSALIHSAFVLALLPLISVVWTLLSNGMERLDRTFFLTSMNNIGARDPNGGAYHAIVGTLEQVGIATLITVPLGLACAIYVVEYGRGRFAQLIRFFVDVMTGIPSIVAGLFVLAFWILIVSPYLNDGRPGYSGFAASLALSVLMLPTIVRSTEERPRRPEVEDDPADCPAHRRPRHRHRRDARHRPRGRGDRPGAAGGRRWRGDQLQPVREQPVVAGALRLPAGRGRVTVRPGPGLGGGAHPRRPRADPDDRGETPGPPQPVRPLTGGGRPPWPCA